MSLSQQTIEMHFKEIVALAEQIRVEGDVLCKIAEEMKKQAEEEYRMEMLNVALAVTRIY